MAREAVIHHWHEVVIIGGIGFTAIIFLIYRHFQS